MKFSLEKGMLYYLLGQISLGHTQELLPLNLFRSCKVQNKWSPGSRYAMKVFLLLLSEKHTLLKESRLLYKEIFVQKEMEYTPYIST